MKIAIYFHCGGLDFTPRKCLISRENVALRTQECPFFTHCKPGRTIIFLVPPLQKKAAIGLEEGTGIKSSSVAKLIGSEELGFTGDLELGICDEASHHIKQIGRESATSVYRDVTRSPAGVVNDTPLGDTVQPKKTHPFNPISVDHNTVLFVDEAAQLSTKQMEKLVRLVRERGAKICLLGDYKQLQPIEAGQSFARGSQDFRGGQTQQNYSPESKS